MRIVGLVGLVASVGISPKLALAGHHHDDAVVHDHRSHESHSEPVVRDHRSHETSHSEPVVRDHRSSSNAVVRDHRDSSSGGSYGSDVYVSEDPVIVDGGGPSPSFNWGSGPSWRLEIGGLGRRFRGPAFSRSGTVGTTSGDTASYDLVSPTPAAGDTAGGAFTMRITLTPTEHLYAGGEVELGGITRSPVQLMTTSRDIDVTSRAMIGTAAVVGARAQHGFAELDAEVAGGMRAVAMTIQSYDATDGDPSASETSVRGVLEARLRGILWMAPHVYLAAQAGTSVLDQRDMNFGLSIGLASRAYGTAR